MPTTEPSAREIVEQHARALIRTVLSDEAGLSRMLKKMVGHTVSEYRGRFLLELIQNGYDAHPADATDGRIAIHFDETEGEHGVLYVANGGSPLSESNFKRMSALGDSDKTIGAGVGNKGVGFKSVFQVCDVPEVYSAAGPDDPGFDGFSFRFGTHADLVAHLDGDVERAEEMAKELSLSLLTVPLGSVPAAVAALRAEGYVTVLRLPAVSGRARSLIEEKLDELLESSSPVMMFLERLHLLSVRRSAESEPSVMTREHSVVGRDRGSDPSTGGDTGASVDTGAGGDTGATLGEGADDEWTLVTLDGHETYEVFKALVPPQRLRDALVESVETNALDERWLAWDADAYVSVAVGVDGLLVDSGAAYTYLPMGEGAKSPLSGHINAPFVTNFSRVDLDPKQPVNQLMLAEIAELCLRTGAAVADGDGEADTVTYLLVWAEHLDVLTAASDRTTGESLDRAMRLPDLRGQWTPVSDLRVWQASETTVVDASSVTAAATARLLDQDRLDAGSAAALVGLAKRLAVGVVPDEQEVAAWVEAVASNLVETGASFETWGAFYDDLPVLFKVGEVLQGRKIVLAVDGSLVPCNEPVEAEAGRPRRRRNRSVFFQPRRTGDGEDDGDEGDDGPDDDTLVTNDADGDEGPDFRPPRSLRNQLTLVHPDLVWRVGARRTPGRDFLESRHLVQPFRTGGLLTLLGRVMRGSVSDNVKRDALEYAFRLFAREPERHRRELAAVGLHVPNGNGQWVPATTARFGRGWGVTGARDLAAVSASATDDLPELNALAEVLVAAPAVFRSIMAPAKSSKPDPADGPGSVAPFGDDGLSSGSVASPVSGPSCVPGCGAMAEAGLGGGAVDDPGAVGRWETFLQAIGVRTTLPVQTLPEPRELAGRDIRDGVLAVWKVPTGLPEEVRQQWWRGLPDSGHPQKPGTTFVTSDAICWLLGQGEADKLHGPAREAYARSVVRTMRTLGADQWATTWRRKSQSGFTHDVPTPLAAFARTSYWIPVRKAGDAGTFEPPDAAWYVQPGDEVAANYSPLVELSLRRLIEATAALTAMVQRTGLRYWGSRKDAAALIDHLTRLLNAGDLADAGAEHLRAALSRAWGEVGDPTYSDLPGLGDGLVVDRAGRMELVPPDERGQERIFVLGSGDRSTTARLIRDLGWPIVAASTDDPDRLREIAEHVISPNWSDDVVVAGDWDIDLLVDDHPWTPDPEGPRLVTELPWLPLVIACTMRFPRASGSGVGRHLESHLEALEAIQVVRCTSIAIATTSGAQPLPKRLRGVLSVAGQVPTLLVENMHDPFTWSEVSTVAEAALELMGQSRYVADLALTVSRIAGDLGKPVHDPDISEIAEVIDQPLVLIQEIDARVHGSVAGLVQRILPVAAHLWGPAAIGWLDLQAVPTRDDLHAAIHELSGGDTATVETILDQGARALDADTVRRSMGIPLGAYNDTLTNHFPGTPLVDYSATHREVFAVRRTQRRIDVIDWMRAAQFPSFGAVEPQADWPRMRDLKFIEEDPAWGTTIDDLTDTFMDSHIDEVVTSTFGPRQTNEGLASWNEVRPTNNTEIRRQLEFLEQLARAWHRKNSAYEPVEGNTARAGAADTSPDAAPDTTSDAAPDSAASDIDTEFAPDALRTLDAAGALDFTVLDGEQLLAWMQRLGLWPHPMPVAATAADLGLTDADLDQVATEQDVARAARLRAERQVTLHGDVIEVDLNYDNLIDAVSGLLATNPASLDTRFATTTLRTLPPATGRGSRGSGARGTRRTPRPARMTDAQRNSIGLTGELIAFHWLQNKEPSPVDETCWKSTYVSFVFPGVLGDDDLGYDFAVPRVEGQVFYEVKATSSEEAGTIELGESEVTMAQEFSRGRRKDRWRLLVIEDAMSTEPRVLMLPNPFAAQSRGLYRFVGNGVRLRFSQ